MQHSFVRAYPPAQPAEGPKRWLIFRNSELLVKANGDQVELIDGEMPLDVLAGEPIFLGTSNGASYLAFQLAAEAAPREDWQSLGLRALFGKLSEDEYTIAGYASQMLFWEYGSRFCPHCGGPTEPVGGDWGRRCTNCGFTRYPQISPAILALVYDGDRVLLTHKAGWGPMFSIIAGFVEPNESLESCVHREVLEEVGCELAEIEYFGSQGWPFPAQLMVGFLCRYASGEITIDAAELDDARWFHVDELPPLPGKLSLSRQLLDHWIENARRASVE